MGKLTKISDVANSFDIPASTLRFWERAGLINFERNDNNNYREFPFETLVSIADIAFAREVGTPLTRYQEIKTSSVDEQEKLLDDFESATRQQMAVLEHTISKVYARKELIHLWMSVRSEPVHIQRAKLMPVYRFDFEDKDFVKLYLDDPKGAVDIIPSADPESYEYGRFLASSNRDLLRPGDTTMREYLYGPLWMDGMRRTNVQEYWDTAEALGKKYGKAICQYLTSGTEEERGFCYYFKVWLEIF